MNEFNQAKKEYEQTPIPQELGDRVEAGIQQGKFNYRRAKRKPFVRSFGAFAACFGLLVGALNVSPTFASAASQVPVLGGLFQVLTVREYNKVEDGIDYQVSVPGVDLASAISSRTLLAGRSGRVTITSGPLVSSVTGAKLLRVS